MRNDLMTLKEVCKETGVTRKIVQTYENYGLVKATTKNKYGYLLYDDAAVKKIKKIRLYQRFGYRLSEIAKLEYMTVDEQVMILKEKINNMYACARYAYEERLFDSEDQYDEFKVLYIDEDYAYIENVDNWKCRLVTPQAICKAELFKETKIDDEIDWEDDDLW